MFTWTTLSIIFKVHSRLGRYLTLPRVTVPDSLQTQAEFHLHTSQHFKAFFQSFRTENARVAAIKIPHGSAAILGSKFTAGRDLLSWSVLLHAAFSRAARPRAPMSEGNLLSPRQCLKGGLCGECVGLVWGPDPRWEAAVNTNTVPGTPQGALSSCLQEIIFSGPRQRHLCCHCCSPLCAPAQQHRSRKQPTTPSTLPALAQPTASSLSWGRRNNSSKWDTEGNKICAF